MDRSRATRSTATTALVAKGSDFPLGVRVAVPHIDLTHESMQRDEVDVNSAVIRTQHAAATFGVRDPDGNAVVIVGVPASK